MRDHHRDPQLLGGAISRLRAIMTARGIDPSAADTTGTDSADAAADPWRATEARIPARYRAALADHPQVVAWVRTIAATALAPSAGARRQVHTGPSLLLAGHTGTGKTHQAYGAIRALIASGVGVRWRATTTADLYAALRPHLEHDPEREIRSLARCPLLVLDDLGTAKTSEWTEEITYRLLNARYNEMLPTLITTNLAIRDLRDYLGDRVASRLAEMTERVVLDGTDRRRRRAA